MLRDMKTDRINGWIIEVDITHQCNLTCRHCNRLCNQEKGFNTSREHLFMDERHIEHLCDQIKRYPKGKVKMIRILGGEPLLSPILKTALAYFEVLKEKGFIAEICVMSNGTVEIPDFVQPYIVFFPPKVREMVAEKGKLKRAEVYRAKNERHVNITLSPRDFDETVEHICDRYIGCGIHYTVYGFSLTAPCFPSLFVFQNNHRYFRRDLPPSVDCFIDSCFVNNVCSFCVYGFHSRDELSSMLTDSEYIGESWRKQIQRNGSDGFREPDVKWINEV